MQISAETPLNNAEESVWQPMDQREPREDLIHDSGIRFQVHNMREVKPKQKDAVTICYAIGGVNTAVPPGRPYFRAPLKASGIVLTLTRVGFWSKLNANKKRALLQ